MKKAFLNFLSVIILIDLLSCKGDNSGPSNNNNNSGGTPSYYCTGLHLMVAYKPGSNSYRPL